MLTLETLNSMFFPKAGCSSKPVNFNELPATCVCSRSHALKKNLHRFLGLIAAFTTLLTIHTAQTCNRLNILFIVSDALGET
jgi:hypothetical protein